MLFPITIFPCVPFASDIFLINQSAETESSCLRVFVSTNDPSPHLCQGIPERLDCSLVIPRSFVVRVMTICAGLRTRCAAAQFTSHRACTQAGHLSAVWPSCPASLHRSPPLERGTREGWLSSQFSFPDTKSWSNILIAPRMSTVLVMSPFKPLHESLSGGIPWESFGSSSGDSNVPLRLISTSLRDTLVAFHHPRIQDVRLRHRCSSLTLG